MPRTRVLAVPATAFVLLAAGCGSSGHKSAALPPGVPPTSGTIPHGPVATYGAPTTTATGGGGGGSATTNPGGADISTKPSTVVTVPGSGTYVLSADAGAGTGPCVTPGLSGTHVAFTVSVTNNGGTSEPLARVAVSVTDPKATTVQPVAALSYSGLCTNFTEPGGTLSAGKTMTFDGSASGVSPSAVLDVTMISTPANDTLGQISVPLG